MITKSNFVIGQECQRCFWFKYNGFEDPNLKDAQAIITDARKRLLERGGSFTKEDANEAFSFFRKEVIEKEKSVFKSELTKIFLNKKKSRISILGEDENKILEKKIFLQIIDHSWRSHLQYLEQLRQVIGLRQYGQKDPLSEFKKEAFVLFEGLLSKIKNDFIKILFNLNIVVSPREKKIEDKKQIVEKDEFQKVGRNEKCPCGSGKKFKHCHGNI